MRGKDINNIFVYIVIIAIIVFINIIAQFVYTSFDLTEDKRFTLADSTIDLLEGMDNVVYADVLLDGKFPAGFQRLQNSTEEMLRSFKSYYPNLEYRFDDPNEGTPEEKKAQYKTLQERGIKGTRLSFKEGNDMVEKYIFPYIVFHFGDRTIIVDLLEDQLDRDPEVTLNKSVSLLEFKIIEALNSIQRTKKKNILFTAGHGEFDKPRVSHLRNELRTHYNTGFVNLDSTLHISPDLDLLIVAKPKLSFTEKHIFQIDQYIMGGGKVLWMIDRMESNLDSINRYGNYVPRMIELGLENMWYKHGFRIEEDLVLDLESSKIPQVVGEAGGKPQTQLFPWFYHPLAVAGSHHSIVNDIDRVNMKFPSTISLIKTKTDITKTVLLQSSPYARVQLYPMQLNFEILRYKPEPKKFNKGNIPVAVLLEGKFESVFKNRISEEVKKDLAKIDVNFLELSESTKQIVISDADFTKNIFNIQTQKIYPIGYNKWEQKVYSGNKEFIMNCINFLTSDNGLLSAKSKQVKLRLLDKVKIEREQLKWQLINILFPILFILLFGIIFNWMRRRKYS